jgi:HK97 family phage major capsid protein
MHEGEFLTGAFGLGAQIWDREQANVRISEHHADYFTKNMLAILAEERIALTVYRPESFVKGVFTAAV